METQFLAIFLLFEKGTAISIFNNNPALYRNICSTCVQILSDLSVWTPKLCFCEVRIYVVKLKSLYSPTSFFTIEVKFDKIQFDDYYIYRPNSFLWLKYILFTSKRFSGFSIPHLDDYLCYEENENTGKKIFYTKYEIFPKIRLQLANADIVLGRSHVCIIIKRKNWKVVEFRSWIQNYEKQEFCPKRYNKATGC